MAVKSPRLAMTMAGLCKCEAGKARKGYQWLPYTWEKERNKNLINQGLSWGTVVVFQTIQREKVAGSLFLRICNIST